MYEWNNRRHQKAVTLLPVLLWLAFALDYRRDYLAEFRLWTIRAGDRYLFDYLPDHIKEAL